MQKVNLLPSDLAPPGLNQELVLLLRKVSVGLGILLAVLFFVWGPLRIELARRDNVLKSMMRKIKESDLLAENIEDLRKRDEQLTQELADINLYLSAGLVWSDKLLQLSRLMPDAVWLTQMSFRREDARGQREEFLDLKGALMAIQDTPPINALSAFVDKVKDDKEFFADFDELLISNIRAAKKQDVDITEFMIKLPIKREGLTIE